MKKIMIAALFVCGFGVNAQAQDYYETKHDVAITVGTGTTSQIFNGLSDFSSVMGSMMITGILSGGELIGYTTYDTKMETPTITAEYFYHVNKVVSLGGIVGFNARIDDMYGNIRYGNDTEKKEKIGEGKRINLTILPAAKFDWLRKKHFGLYSKVAAGITLNIDKQTVDGGDGKEHEVAKDTETFFNFQASVLGVEAGSQRVRGFAELGFGEQGIILAGIRCKF